MLVSAKKFCQQKHCSLKEYYRINAAVTQRESEALLAYIKTLFFPDYEYQMGRPK